MKIGDIVRHLKRPDLSFGKVSFVYPSGMLKVEFGKNVFSGIPENILAVITDEELRKIELINKNEQIKLKKQIKADEIFIKLKSLLAAGQYLEADNFANLNKIQGEEYVELKSKSIIDLYVDNKGNPLLSSEQARAVSMVGTDLLIKARAGSGKTHTLIYKILFLIKYYGIAPDKILVLTFNRQAADSFQSKINKLGAVSFKNVMTFHSLAYSIARNKININLVSDDPGRYAKKELSKKIEKIINRSCENKDTSSLILNIFRDTFFEFACIPTDMTTKEYLNMRRRVKKVTLDGNYVKSYGEKVVGDFLFEHNIDYKYEECAFKGRRSIRPDFSVINNFEKPIVIEYWGISFNKPQLGVPDGWRKTRDEYLEERSFKLEWYKTNGIVCIELSYDDMLNGRVYLENKLKDELEKYKINAVRLDEDIIIERVYRTHVKKFTTLCTGFIQKSKKNCFSPEELIKKLEELSNNYSVNISEGSKAFVECGAKVFMSYEEEMAKNNLIDFDDLILKAVNVVNETTGSCLFGYEKNDRPLLSVNEIEYVLIDEFQDFSLLFHKLVSSMRAANKKFKVIAVGDDWQAINRFAGSDTSYINEFTQWFPESKTVYLLTNRRSAKAIVSCGNNLMSKFGVPSKSLDDKPEGRVEINTLRNINCEYLQKLLNCQKIKQTVADHLDYCLKIIEEHKDKTMGFLYRNNSFYGIELSQFRDLLIQYASDNGHNKSKLENLITVTTLHQMKGDEREVIVIMDVNDSTYPFIHEFSELYGFIFNESIQTVVEDERKLFYVGITRAKYNLYICQTVPESRFLPSKYK